MSSKRTQRIQWKVMSYKVGIFIATFALMEVSNILRQKPNKSIPSPPIFSKIPHFIIFFQISSYLFIKTSLFYTLRTLFHAPSLIDDPYTIRHLRVHCNNIESSKVLNSLQVSLRPPII